MMTFKKNYQLRIKALNQLHRLVIASVLTLAFFSLTPSTSLTSFFLSSANAATNENAPRFQPRFQINKIPPKALQRINTIPSRRFQLEEATIDDIQTAIKRRKLTSTELVYLYLDRIKKYNGVCVNQPDGLLGPISTIAKAGKINALQTLNIRPSTRQALGFDSRMARSLTDPVDADLMMPDALETAAALDEYFARTGKLVGPLHGVVFSIKDQFDTYDMRTTSGGDAFYANDRPPEDSTVVKRLREAGAIILGKATMGEYAAGGIPGTRSTFGGTVCNAYDTERDPGVSSGGSAVSVATNLVTCSIGEETGTSVRQPAKNNSLVGLAPTRELVSANGMIRGGINERTGPICRNVKDVAMVLDVYAGFDPEDELTAFSVGRIPSKPYHSFADSKKLNGMRIGVVREYMDKNLFSIADVESIDIIEKAIVDLSKLGATIVDPGQGGALFQQCVDKYVPRWLNQGFISQFPGVFPFNADGTPSEDHIPLLVDMFFDTSLVPKTSVGRPNIRNIGPAGSTTGEDKYFFNIYLAKRGDPNIQTITDLYNKANFFEDPFIANRRSVLQSSDNDLTLNANRMQHRFSVQTPVLQCFAEMKLDAVVYPTGNIPPAKLTSPREPTVNDRPATVWTLVNGRGFPAITVPAGFTTTVYDRDSNQNLIETQAKLPVGIDILSRPFEEATLFKIAYAYEAATKHRVPPLYFRNRFFLGFLGKMLLVVYFVLTEICEIG
jgi:amidase